MSAPYIQLTDRIAMVPVAHGIQAYADEVRRAILALNPACVAVELPRGLAEEVLSMVEMLPEIHLLAYRPVGGTALMIPADPCDSLIEAVRLATENFIPLEFLDIAEAAGEDSYVHLPDDFSISQIGLADYAEQCLKALPKRPFDHREGVIASRLVILEERHESVLYIGGMGHARNLRELLTKHRDLLTDPQWEETKPERHILPLHERKIAHAVREIPYLAWLYENYRPGADPEGTFPILEAIQRILQAAAEIYEIEYDERITLTEWKALMQFARNLSIVRAHLRPRLYELITAAKGCVDDDFGAICLEVATSYPPNRSDEDEPEETLPHQSLDLHCEFGSEKCRLNHAYPHPELQEITFNFRRRRPSMAEKMRWRDQFAQDVWDGAGICSWPPEDIFIENFFRTIRHRAFQKISEDQSASEEFTSSMLDGLDIRETMRRWHEKKLIVRRERIPPGKIGPVVLIWRDVPVDSPAIWQTCLYAENQNESDIAIYARPLGKEMVGPGITRTEYHGILSVFPAKGIPDIWSLVPFYFHKWRSCARVLTAAAVMLSDERYIAVVSETPPDMELRNFARMNEKSLIYLPLAMFSKALLKRARQCHILAGKRIRDWAGDYIPRL